MSAVRTRWGWHRLADDWARRLVARAGIEPGDLVLDLGAGTGAITHHLLQAGARVVAFELHPQRVALLRSRFAGTPDVKVVRADVTDLWLPGRPFRVVSNPPFAATAAVLRRLLAPSSQLVRADLVVPRYVAVRTTAGRGAGSRRWTAAFELAVAMRVPRSAFHPAAPDDAAVLTIVRRGYDRRRRRVTPDLLLGARATEPGRQRGPRVLDMVTQTDVSSCDVGERGSPARAHRARESS